MVVYLSVGSNDSVVNRPTNGGGCYGFAKLSRVEVPEVLEKVTRARQKRAVVVCNRFSECQDINSTVGTIGLLGNLYLSFLYPTFPPKIVEICEPTFEILGVRGHALPGIKKADGSIGVN